MGSNLKVVGEVEIPSAVETPPTTVAQSAPSSESSPHLVALLAEIRRVLNARAGALLAMFGALGLTAAAMTQQTTMALLVALSFDICALIPMLWIAYLRKE